MEYNELKIGMILLYNKTRIKIIDVSDPYGAFYVLEESNMDGKFLFNPDMYLLAEHKLRNRTLIKTENVSESERAYFDGCLNGVRNMQEKIYNLSNLYIYDKQF